MNYKRYVLMNPGPVAVDQRVRDALTGPDLCHREPEFAELMTSLRDKVRLACLGDSQYSSVLFTGSGTAALEAVVSSVVPPTGRLLVLDNGHYGERIAQIAKIHNISHVNLTFGWGVPYRLDSIEAALDRDPSITHVAMVHHETSTGMLNPLDEVGLLVSRHGRSLIVDAISSLGGELLDIRRDCIDWCISTANKCIEGIPGVSFVCAPRVALEALAEVPSRTLYLDVHSHYLAQEVRKEPAFTPAVQTMYAFDTALDLLLKEGVAARNARYTALAQQLREGLEARGYRLMLPAQDRSCLLTVIHLPENVTYTDLHDRLKQHGFVIYAGQGTLSRGFFRLSTMGQITHDDIGAFLQALGPVQGEMRQASLS